MLGLNNDLFRVQSFIFKKIKFFSNKSLTKRLFISIIYTCGYDPLAQLAEHLTFNQGVRSSNLRWVTIKVSTNRRDLFFMVRYGKMSLLALTLFQIWSVLQTYIKGDGSSV